MSDIEEEPGGRRVLAARWMVTARLRMETASQIGSQEAADCDQTFERDEETGRPALPGTTLAGALRSALRGRLQGDRGPGLGDPPEVQALFGYLAGASAHQSRLIVFDSVAEEVGGKDTVIRDGVRLETRTGLAAEGAKYDRELSLPGLTFPLRFALLVDLSDVEPTLVAALVAALEALVDGSTAFGARKNRGLGRCKALDFRAKRYDLTCELGWREYAKTDDLVALPPGNKGQGYDKPHKAIGAVAHRDGWQGWKYTPLADARQRLTLDFDLNIMHTLLIRSPGREADSADVVHLTEAGQALLSGTSLAGALRAHCGRIARTLAADCLASDDGADRLLEGLFGTTNNGSRVLVGEAAIENPRVYRQTRNKIDRFTGGTIDTALFEEEPVVGGGVKVKVQVLNPTDADTALLLLAARDLVEGLLPLGGEASVGRGIMMGIVTAALPKKKDGAVTYQTVTIGGNGCPDEQATLLKPYLQELIRKLSVGVAV